MEKCGKSKRTAKADVLAAISSASSLQSDWVKICDVLADYAGAFGIALVPYTTERRAQVVVNSRSLDRFMAAYVSEGWYKADVLSHGVHVMRRKGFALDHDVIDMNLAPGIPFYRDFVFKHGMRGWMGILFNVAGEDWCIAVLMPWSQDSVPDYLVDAHAEIAAAFASRANKLLRGVEAHWDSVFDTFGDFSRGVVLLAPNNLVLRANETARSQLPQLGKGNVRLALFASANGTYVANQDIAGAGGQVFSVEVVPVPPNLQHFAMAAVAVAFITVKDNRAERAIASLSARFGLLPSETRIVRSLLLGDTVSMAAARHNISPGTARQQLKAVFRKTGANGQPALLRLLLGLTGS